MKNPESDCGDSCTPEYTEAIELYTLYRLAVWCVNYLNIAHSINLSINNNPLLGPLVLCRCQSNVRVRSCLTSHFSFKENKVLKKNTIQIIGQIMRPSQKIRASASVAVILLGETCVGKGIMPSFSLILHVLLLRAG